VINGNREATGGILRSPLKATALVVLHAVRLLSHLVPRSGNLWIFDSWRGTRFTDNAKYLFLHVARSNSGIRAVWICRSADIVRLLRDRGYEAYTAGSFGGMYATLRASVLVYNSLKCGVAHWLTGGITRVNLWHGLALKKIVYDVHNEDENWGEKRPSLERLWYPFLTSDDLILIPADFWKGIFRSAFRVGDDRLLVAGYPRNDALLGEVQDEDLGVDTAALEEMRRIRSRGEKILMLFPTFRGYSSDPLQHSNLDFASLDGFLSQQGAHLFVKFHHELDLDTSGFSNVHSVRSASDPYPLLRHVDTMITDYSSIYFDYLYLNRPIIFYPYDLEHYATIRRGLYFDYNSFTPGPKAYDLAGLKTEIRNAVQGVDHHRGARQELRKKVWGTVERDFAASVRAGIAARLRH
jgi:CDP-glycerol glycerophosphotransferase (TagB/SpsB family)